MNMKKTIAGVMAGAMAVSAMAATVSADQDTIVLTYDLNTYIPVEDDGQAVYVETYANAAEAVYTFTKDSTRLSVGADGIKDTADDTYGLKFAADAAHIKDVIFAEITVNALTHTADGSASKSMPYTMKFYYDDNHLPTSSDFIKSTLREDGNKAIIIPLSFKEGGETNKLPANIYNLNAGLGYTNAPEDIYGFNSVTVKLTYTIPSSYKTVNGGSWSGYDAVYGILGIDDTVYNDVDIKALNSSVSSKSTAFGVDPATAGFTTATVGAKNQRKYPFKTVLNPTGKTRSVEGAHGVYYTLPAANDVIGALTSRKVDGNFYTKPVAVINDAIANNENVVFTFYSYEGYVTTAKSKLYNEWIADVDADLGYKTSAYDWYNPSFAQHLYTNIGDSYSAFGTTDYDMYGSYSSAWGINLFSGGIVVNNGLSMQLNDTDKFSWGNNTLSFDWFTITDDGKITNAKTLLTSMLLYTPVDWYWDRLTVEVGGESEESVAGGEGIDGEGDVIEDEVDEILDEVIAEIEDETPVVEDETPVVEETPEEVVTPVQSAPSPSTGNAPVALAVIPVALAAAAVVAKKRG